MSLSHLKECLQAIDPQSAELAVIGHVAKSKDLYVQQRIDEEYEKQEAGYAGLGYIPVKIFEFLRDAGYSEDAVALISTGANIVVHVLIELAEVQNMPPLGTPAEPDVQ